MGVKNINVAVGGHQGGDYPKVYNTVYIKPNIPFALQVTEPNTKYVIRHKIDLGGKGDAVSDVDFTNAETHEIAGVEYYYVPFTANGKPYTLLDDSCVFVTSDWTGLSERTITPDEGTVFMIASMTGGLHTGAYINAEVVTMPENCILEFDGGSLDNGVIVGQDTVFINVGDVKIWGDNLVRLGTWREHSGGGGGSVEDKAMVKWYMLNNESNNWDNSTDYNMQFAGIKYLISLEGLDKVYFEQTVKDLRPIFNKEYILTVKFHWFNDRGSWVNGGNYVRLNEAQPYFDIPDEAKNGYCTFNLGIYNYNAAIFREVVEEAKIYTNLLGRERIMYNENLPTKSDSDDRRYKDSLYRNDLVVSNFGYSKWRITDSDQYGENSIWRPQVAGEYAECILDLGEYPGYDGIVVEGDDEYRCWFTFVKKYPTEDGEVVQQSSVYGTSTYIHEYLSAKDVVIRRIPSDAKFLVVSWRHGSDSISYMHPKAIRFIKMDVNSGALSYAKIANDVFMRRSYPIMASAINRASNKLNEFTICHWNVGHYSMGDYPYSTITEEEENAKKTAFRVLYAEINPDMMLYNEYSHQFSPNYTSKDILDKRVQYEGRIDRYCCNAMYSDIYVELLNVLYFPYSFYLQENVYTRANDFVNIWRTYINDHAITIAQVHLRSSNPTINLAQCEYLISYLSGYSNVLIVGDFNREDMSVFTSAGYSYKITGTTHMSGDTPMSLDHFVYRGFVDIKDAHIVETDLSDHYPIVATITTTDNKKLSGTTAERPTGVVDGFRYFDTDLGMNVYKYGNDWVDANGNIPDWEVLGTLDQTVETFDGYEVIKEQNTYHSDWAGWTHAVDGTIYLQQYKIQGNPLSEGDILRITINPIAENTEWALLKLNEAGTDVDYTIISSSANNTYNKTVKTVEIPASAVGNTLNLNINSDVGYSAAKVVISVKHNS